ncbi:MAG: S-layer homology domain-containing protein, partial [Oscillospiraceae bacterium]|nr:S-layer homology domain-containing protein [Oscillospiraceae bacterium]
ANNGTGTMSSDTVSNGENYIIKANTFTRANYSFTGWNTQANGSGTAFAPGATIGSVTSNTTLYAQWTTLAAVSTMDVNPSTIAHGGGNSGISVFGGNLVPANTRFAAFLNNSGSPLYERGSTGSIGSTSVATTLNFPANTTAANRVYTIRVSLDGGATWLATPTATVTVNTEPLTTIQWNVHGPGTTQGNVSAFIYANGSRSNPISNGQTVPVGSEVRFFATPVAHTPLSAQNFGTRLSVPRTISSAANVQFVNDSAQTAPVLNRPSSSGAAVEVGRIVDTPGNIITADFTLNTEHHVRYTHAPGYSATHGTLSTNNAVNNAAILDAGAWMLHNTPITFIATPSGTLPHSPWRVDSANWSASAGQLVGTHSGGGASAAAHRIVTAITSPMHLQVGFAPNMASLNWDVGSDNANGQIRAYVVSAVNGGTLSAGDIITAPADIQVGTVVRFEAMPNATFGFDTGTRYSLSISGQTGIMPGAVTNATTSAPHQGNDWLAVTSPVTIPTSGMGGTFNFTYEHRVLYTHTGNGNTTGTTPSGITDVDGAWVAHGTTAEFHANPDAHHHISAWARGGSDWAGALTSPRTLQITAPETIGVAFAETMATVAWTTSTGNGFGVITARAIPPAGGAPVYLAANPAQVQTGSVIEFLAAPNATWGLGSHTRYQIFNITGETGTIVPAPTAIAPVWTTSNDPRHIATATLTTADIDATFIFAYQHEVDAAIRGTAPGSTLNFIGAPMSTSATTGWVNRGQAATFTAAPATHWVIENWAITPDIGLALSDVGADSRNATILPDVNLDEPITVEVRFRELAAPSEPQNFTVTAGDMKVTLAWTVPANDGGSVITGFEVSSDNGATWITATNNTGHTFTGLTNDTAYTFRVRAVNSIGSGAEATVTATPRSVGGGGGGGGGGAWTPSTTTTPPAEIPEAQVPLAGYDDELETPQFPFIDVAVTDWFYPYVRTVWENQLFQGTSYNMFTPQGNMTRAMFIQVLYRIEHGELREENGAEEIENENYDSDNAQRTWYDAAMQWATEQGLIEGLGNGEFQSGIAITREEMAVILHNYVLSRDISLPQGTARLFTDHSAISTWALEGVLAIQTSGIILGHLDGRFAPQDTATRAEVAAIFARFREIVDLPVAVPDGEDLAEDDEEG